jgi:hypothetical protein
LRHNLEDILVIALATLLCDGEDFQDRETFGQEREGELKKFLELPHGIPDESPFFRVFRRVKSEGLTGNLYEWIAEAREGTFTAVNIDGKTIRGSGNTEHSALHVVSAWAGEEELILGQMAVDEKSNEIRGIPKLLALLNIKDAMVRIDASD